MQFDPNNKVIQLCAQGMEMETKQKPAEAKVLFLQAWEVASNDFEKFTSAHYVARHQATTEDKLKWDETALSFAVQINNNSMEAYYPSLYLNIAKCYEDLKDFESAYENYRVALSYAERLPENGYGQMIRSGINNGLQRLDER
jgi:rifampin ADP-ribosylating transferase